MKYVLKSANYFNGEKIVKQDVIINNNKLVNTYDDTFEIINCENKLVTKAFIDAHVHTRDPGFTHKEDILSATLSAIKGGYYMIFAMPNTKPIMDNEKLIKEFNNKKAHTKIKTYSAITKNLTSNEIVKNVDNLVCGYSNDGVGVNSSVLHEFIKTTNKVIAMHLEEPSIKEFPRREYQMLIDHLKVINKKTKYHVCHISSQETLKIIEAAQQDGYNITCEVSPHHLILTKDDVKGDTNYKMNPPLAKTSDVNYLIDGINKGKINIIATDHAPHTVDEKNQEFSKAPMGIIGIEHAFSTLYTHLIKTNKVELSTILKMMSYNVEEIFEMQNDDVNLVVIDLEKEITVNNLSSKSQNTPFLNTKLYGEVMITIIDGEIKWQKN